MDSALEDNISSRHAEQEDSGQGEVPHDTPSSHVLAAASPVSAELDPCWQPPGFPRELASATAGASTSQVSTANTSVRRRRGMDQSWEDEAERVFEATQAAHAPSPAVEASATQSTPTSGVDSDQAVPAAGQTAPAAPAAEAAATQMATCGLESAYTAAATGQASAKAPPAASKPSTLRRLKQLDAMTAGAIEQECGAAMRGSDSFRLTLDNTRSVLKRETRVLIVMAGSTFLCEEPISEESAVSSQSSPKSAKAKLADGGSPEEGNREGACLKDDEAEEPVEGEYEDDFEDFDEEDEEGTVVAELCFFRAKPSRGGLARKLGAVPVLHMTLSTSDGLRENLEFVGVHQRRYCVEEPGTDAIAQNLTMSLLKVALEFVFHPSRTRYTKERLILRECSSSDEARESREASLPQMAEEVRSFNSKIEKVTVECLPPRVRLSGSAALKGRSFLILDEDVLKVAPAKDSVSSSRSSPKGTFKGLGSGFLNSSKAKKKGFSKPDSPTAKAMAAATSGKEAMEIALAAAGSGEASSSSSTPANVSSGDVPERTEDVSAVQTDRGEKGRLLLGAADVQMKVTTDVGEFAKQVIPGCGNISAITIPEEDEEEPLEDQEPANISDLANQLFGDGDDASLYGRENELEPSENSREETDSTGVPSPKGTSLGGGQLSERSESVTEDGADADALNSRPAGSGIRLLQQRRRAQEQERADEAKNESEELLQLGMKQRW